MMKKLFRFIIRSIPLILIIAVIAGYFTPLRPWYVRQYNKAKGVYHVHQGDKAYEKSRQKDSNIALELSSAVKFYNQGLKEYPEHYQARCNLANIYVSFEDYTSAMEQYRLALKYNPNYLECRMNMGILEAEEFSNYDEAIAQYQKVADSKRFEVKIPYIYNNADSTKANKMNAYYNMGLAYRGKTTFTPKDRLKGNQNLRNAVIAYNKAVEAYNKNFKNRKDRNNYDVLYNLSLTHQLLGNTKEAGLNYCKAIEADPRQYEAHLNLAILLDGIKEHKEAIKEYEKAGLLIEDGDIETVKYLNQLLSESYKRNAIKEELQQIKTPENQTVAHDENNIIIEEGRPKLKEESYSEYYKMIKTCDSKRIFKEMM